MYTSSTWIIDNRQLIIIYLIIDNLIICLPSFFIFLLSLSILALLLKYLFFMLWNEACGGQKLQNIIDIK